MVAIEAMACGLPVVTVNEELNSTQEFVKTNNGLVVDPTPEAVAEGVYHILSDDCLRKSMSEKAMTFARHFSWARIAGELEKFYNQLVADKK